MFRKPVFWAAFAALSVACAAFAVANFPRAFSIVELDLEMDREAALSQARRLAGELGWGPSDYRQAASFRVDDRVRSFVELEGGGPEAFAGLLSDGPFHPYQWVVRHFRAGEVREVEVRFRPDGTPYGFRVNGWRRTPPAQRSTRTRPVPSPRTAPALRGTSRSNATSRWSRRRRNAPAGGSTTPSSTSEPTCRPGKAASACAWSSAAAG